MPGDIVEFLVLGDGNKSHTFTVTEPGLISLPPRTYVAWVNGQRVFDQGCKL